MKRTPLRSKIPDVIREQLSEDPYMQVCLFCEDLTCNGQIEWHHAFTYAGKRRNELWSLIPLCHHHHSIESVLREKIDEAVRQRIDHFDDFVRSDFYRKYPKSDLFRPRTNPKE